MDSDVGGVTSDFPLLCTPTHKAGSCLDLGILNSETITDVGGGGIEEALLQVPIQKTIDIDNFCLFISSDMRAPTAKHCIFEAKHAI